MIRQAINCDICGAEKQASNYWFVAYEQGAELKLRGWESPQNSRKNVKHLCGQKCAQRLVANFMASQMSATHGAEQARDTGAETMDAMEQSYELEPAASTEKPERTSARVLEPTDRSLLNVPASRHAVAEGEWVGPVRVKEETWERPGKLRIEHEPFVNASRARISGRSQRLV